MDSTSLIGVIGAVIILTAFLLNQTNKLKNDAILYDLLNFCGSVLLTVYAILLNSIPFVILNIIWGGVSLRDILFTIYQKWRNR